ncbi:uncharacterized protein LOC110807476 [Carica papaya]|uniref:uncharacterized protein LOC110807476 n=1 Tax=Carica papaya TaxID=3649 RepID=UPI000B8CA246|nr:uncharacterized protein LOC110807476 [Carica papaya]
MNDTTGKTASGLAITEKRPHRPGGCVGIFFQLFDWNRRFAKKKLFSRKLLPPARAKKASKKFGGDEKMPKSKLHLIADENSGGFPNVKKNSSRTSVDKEQKHEMRAPGLVARLMGLESMPALRDKPRKASLLSDNHDAREERLMNSQSMFHREEDLSLEIGNGKLESRPQKIQKTGMSDRRVAVRFGTDALQIKSVLSRTRKHHHHPKLASPLKSPRISSARMNRTSRLIDAATKILEPGLQATNRAKSALPYASSMQILSKKELMSEGAGVMSPDEVKQSGYNVTASKSLLAQTPCKNCGNLVDVVDSVPDEEDLPFGYPSSVPDSITASPKEQVKNKLKHFMSSLDHERNVTSQRSWDQSESFAIQEDDNMHSSNGAAPERKFVSREAPAPSNSTSQHVRHHKDEPSTSSFKGRTQAHDQMSLSRDRTTSKAKFSHFESKRAPSTVCTIGAKDFVALNRSLSGRTRPRVPKVDNSNFDMERKSCNRQEDSLAPSRSPVRKRRTSINSQVDSSGYLSPLSGKQRTAKGEVGVGKEMSISARSMERACSKSKISSQGEGSRVNGNVFSFTFNSPLRETTGICTDLKDRRKNQNHFVSRNIPDQRKLMSNEKDGKASLWKQLPLKGDALGALLEQKLEELTSQEADEMTTEGTLPKRSTAMILQELISALTAEQSVFQDGRVSDRDMARQTKGKTEGSSTAFVNDSDHLSPGSVLEASFSNDSCFSSSLEDSSGQRLHLDSGNSSYYQPQLREPDTDLLDSASSLNTGQACYEIVYLVNQISSIFSRINLADLGISGMKHTHAKEVILNAELLFGKVTPRSSHGTRFFLIGPFLLDELEILAGAIWTDFNCLPGFEETNQSNQLRGFLFDSTIEYLDSQYGRYCNLGFEAWRKLQLCMNTEMLIREVGAEVSRWRKLAGMAPDELIEWEMSHFLGKWTDFEIEAFEAGAHIGTDILQILVEEVVIDLWECKQDSL